MRGDISLYHRSPRARFSERKSRECPSIDARRDATARRLILHVADALARRARVRWRHRE